MKKTRFQFFGLHSNLNWSWSVRFIYILVGVSTNFRLVCLSVVPFPPSIHVEYVNWLFFQRSNEIIISKLFPFDWYFSRCVYFLKAMCLLSDGGGTTLFELKFCWSLKTNTFCGLVYDFTLNGMTVVCWTTPCPGSNKMVSNVYLNLDL